MPKIRITELPPTYSMAPTDIFPMVNVGEDATYKINLQDLSSNLTLVTSASYSITASLANTASYSLTASYAVNGGVTSITAGPGINVDTSTGDVTITNTGDVTVAYESSIQGSTTFFNFTGAGVTATVSSNTASIAIPGGGTTNPGGSDNQIQYRQNSTTFGGVPTLTYDGSLLRATGSFTGSFTGNLTGTASYVNGTIFNSTNPVTSASYALSSSYSVSASYALSSSYAISASVADKAKSVSSVLTQGSGITSFSYDGSSAQNVEVSGTLGMATNAITKWTGNAFASSSLIDDGTIITGKSSIRLSGTGSVLTGSFTGSFTGSINVLGTLVLGSGQIQFPATQNASSNANTLDDYEEGNWDPEYLPGTGTFATMTYGLTRQGSYTKIGKRVFITGFIITNDVNLTGASGDLRITNLPFTSDPGADDLPQIIVTYVDLWDTGVGPSAGRADTTTEIVLYRQRSSGTGQESVAAAVGDLVTGANTGYNQMYFFGYYNATS